jgi:hypothetical protein
MTLYTYKAKAYAILIKAGKYALTAEDNPNSLPVVPAEYAELTAKYLVE